MSQLLISVTLSYVDCVADVVSYCVTLVYNNLSSKGLLNSTRGVLTSIDPKSRSLLYFTSYSLPITT